ncbi:MAG: pyridoxamine 5'-phosphate oxidase family protein [Actinomycetota bacterium]
MRWSEFVATCPEIAPLAEARFRADELVFLGTIRSDGTARVSPCEVDFAEGELLMGMMWRSHKALDLLRDPRITVHSTTADRTNPGGDVKLRGLAVDVSDPALRQAYRDTLQARIDWAPDEPEFHLFSLDVGSAAYLRFGDDGVAKVWEPVLGLRERPLH